MGAGSQSNPSSPVTAAPLKVVHIFSPRIFRTDAHNFRSLVQCLTGNKRQLCDDDSDWIPLGCVELTPRKRHHHQQHYPRFRAQVGVDIDIVSTLISPDAPLPDLLPPPFPLAAHYDPILNNNLCTY